MLAENDRRRYKSLLNTRGSQLAGQETSAALAMSIAQRQDDDHVALVRMSYAARGLGRS